jgi:hypothetical protein
MKGDPDTTTPQEIALPYDNEHRRPLSMLIRRATDKYKATNFPTLLHGYTSRTFALEKGKSP